MLYRAFSSKIPVHALTTTRAVVSVKESNLVLSPVGGKYLLVRREILTRRTRQGSTEKESIRDQSELQGCAVVRVSFQIKHHRHAVSHDRRVEEGLVYMDSRFPSSFPSASTRHCHFSAYSQNQTRESNPLSFSFIRFNS